MKNLLLKFCFVLFFTSLNSFSSQRALYVDNFNSILGNNNKEEQLLSFAQKNNFKTLILYELHKVNKRFPLTDSLKNSVLAKFISKAKTIYGIQKVSASGESGGFFIDYINPYNNSRKMSNEKFDIYNLEYEYWKVGNSDFGGYYCENYLRKNGIPCNRRGSFNYYVESLSVMRILADENEHPIEVECYIGNYKKSEIRKIIKYSDQILISGYASNIKNSYKNVRKMLKIISECTCNPKVSIILSAETEYMGGYLKYNSLEETESNFITELKNKDLDLFNNINLIEFTYYNYSYLMKSVNFENYRRTGIKNN